MTNHYRETFHKNVTFQFKKKQTFVISSRVSDVGKYFENTYKIENKSLN